MPHAYTEDHLVEQPAIGLFAGFILLWQLAVSVFGIREYLLPGPYAVWQSMLSDEIPWLSHAWITGVEILGAFLLAGVAGVALGMAIAWSQGISRALTPFPLPAHATVAL